jgi:signal transduction histidine kinase
MGLGLAYSKLAVEAHGGYIFYKSGEDKGSVFTFTLPGDRSLRDVEV